MGQRCVEVGGLFGSLVACLAVLGVANLAHQVHAVGYHDEYDAHVLGKGQEQVAEVLALRSGQAGLCSLGGGVVELAYALQPVQDVSHGRAEGLCCLVGAEQSGCHAGLQHDGHDGIAAQPNLVDGQQRCLQAADNGVQAEEVSPDGLLADCAVQQLVQPLFISGQQPGFGFLFQRLVQIGYLALPGVVRRYFVVHLSSLFLTNMQMYGKNGILSSCGAFFLEKL